MNDEFLAGLRGDYSPRRKYLVGVSGGRDSVALLDCLCEAGIQKLVVCHLNHGLRGADAAGDAAFVQELADQRDLPTLMRKVSVPELAQRENWSIETAARMARRAFFAEASRELRCPRVFLAHHADDQAETVLMNLARGSGMRGLSGMRRESLQRINGVELTLLRPFLELRRAEVDAWIEARGLEFREDASNADPRIGVRNQVRLRLMPGMNEIFGRDVAVSLNRLAELAAEDESLIEEAFADALVLAAEESLPVKRLAKLHTALRQRIVRRWLRARGIADCGLAEVRRVESMLIPPLSAAPAKVNLPGGWHARRRAGLIFLEAPEDGVGDCGESAANAEG